MEVAKIVAVFESEGKKVVVKSGATMLEAAKNAGVGIRSECGGKGFVENVR